MYCNYCFRMRRGERERERERERGGGGREEGGVLFVIIDRKIATSTYKEF